MNGLFHMDLHFTVRLIIVVVALGMFWLPYWLVLARKGRVFALNLSGFPNFLVGKIDAIAKVVCFEQTTCVESSTLFHRRNSFEPR
jgi:hypothetical protein